MGSNIAQAPVPAHRISLTPPACGAYALGEPRSAFQNLVFNSRKYTPDEGEIRILLVADE